MKSRTPTLLLASTLTVLLTIAPYTRAPAQDVAESLELARTYYRGDGVARDPARAASLYALAAAAKNPDALYELGFLYESGDGVPRDIVKAVTYYRSAAMLGHVDAQFRLGLMLQAGIGLTADPDAAKGYYEQAARQGHTVARLNLGLMYLGDAGIPENLFLAQRLFTQAADTGYPPAKYHLGRLYWEGRGVKIDRRHAEELFRAAAEAGYADAQLFLGMQYKRFGGGERWLRAAADQGKEEALVPLGDIYLDQYQNFDTIAQPGRLTGSALAARGEARRLYQRAAESTDEEIRRKALDRLRAIARDRGNSIWESILELEPETLFIASAAGLAAIALLSNPEDTSDSSGRYVHRCTTIQLEFGSLPDPSQNRTYCDGYPVSDHSYCDGTYGDCVCPSSRPCAH